MSELPPLKDLEGHLGQIPPEVDIATALIATVEPNILDSARAETYQMTGFAALVHLETTKEAKAAEADYDRVIALEGTQESKKQARLRLERLLADEAGATQTQQKYARDLRLARAVDRKRHALAKPLRWGAALTSALVMSGLGAGLTYMAESDANHISHKQAQIEASNTNTSLTERQILGLSLFSGALALVGSIGGYVAIGNERQNRFARRRAIRILNDANTYR